MKKMSIFTDCKFMDRIRQMDFSRYNPEGSLLRCDQKELSRILQVVADICRDNGIQWWMDSGTLLGAMRHKGFIPWDDDIDIVLMKEDYDRLEKILCELESDEFVFHCIRTDKDYINTFGKFRKKEGCVKVKSKRYDYYRWAGIGIDIFAIEKTSRLSVSLARFFYKLFINYTAHVRCRCVRHALISLGQFICFRLLFPLFRLIGKINPKGEYHYALGTGWTKAAYAPEMLLPVSEAEFEGMMMPAPHDAEGYLKVLYGDWRKLPTEEQIRKAIHCQEYKDEIFGKE